MEAICIWQKPAKTMLDELHKKGNCFAIMWLYLSYVLIIHH